MNRLQIAQSVNRKETILAVLLLCCSGCASSGGPSLASMNPFRSQEPASPRNAGVIASTAAGARGQLNTMSSAMKSAYAKTSEGIVGIFGGASGDVVDGEGNPIAADDPLRLDNRPKSIGPEVFVANGQLWETSGNHEKALENYTKALGAEPNNAPALASVARLLYRQGKYDEAVTYFERATKASPNDATLYSDWGMTLAAQEEYDAATATIQKALAIAPGNSRFANHLASVQFKSGKPDQAMATLAQHNKPAVAHYNMAYLEFNEGQYENARVQLTEALKYEPQAGEDTAIRRAVERSRELLARLDGPAGKAMNIARAAPQALEAAQQVKQAAQETFQQFGGASDASYNIATGKETGAETRPSAGPVISGFSLPPPNEGPGQPVEPAASSVQQ